MTFSSFASYRMAARRLSRATVAFAAAIVCVLATTSSAGAASALGPRRLIVGGSPVLPGAASWAAFIQYAGSTATTTTCSGTVIAPTVILTAAHCVLSAAAAREPAAGFVVMTGDSNRTGDRVMTSSVRQVAVDPGYNPATRHDDAAVLVLATATTAPSLALATPADAALLTPGTTAVVDGWGLTAPADPRVPDVLQTVATMVQAPDYCAARIGLGAFDPTAMLCTIAAPADAAGACFGDSGGPVIADDLPGQAGDPTQIGITDAVEDDCATDLPDYDTRVDAISAWARGWIAYAAAHRRHRRHSASSERATPTVPRMTPAQARSYVRQTLAGALGARFATARYRSRYRSRCRRRSSSAFVCRPSWAIGSDDYSATVALGFRRLPAGVGWSGRYAIDWVSAGCRRPTGRPRGCTVHRTHGVSKSG